MEWCKSDCGKYRIESLTARTLPGALKVIKDTFCFDEPVCIGTEVNKNPEAVEEILELCADAALDGVSVVAVEISNEEVVATSINKLQVSDKSYMKTFAEERCTQPSSKALIEFMADVKFFEMYEVDCSLELLFTATLREHRRRQLSFLLMKASIEVGKELKNGPVSIITLQDLGPKYSYMKPREVTKKVPRICQALCTSIATQKNAKAFGFTAHLRLPLRKFEYDGKTLTDRLEFDPYCEAMARPLD